MQIIPKDIERFWKCVDRRGPDDCWPWTGSFGQSGYGRFWCDGKTRRAHRVSFTIKNGPIAKNDVIRHRCDNPPCCNDAHLLSGTHAENIDDRDQRGRTARPIGEKNAMAVLNESQVMEIRRRIADGETQRAVGNSFRVAQTHVSHIVLGKIWGNLPILPHNSKRGPPKGRPLRRPS